MPALPILHPIERQIRIAERLAPAESFRARSACLLSCGDAGLEGAARRALRESFGIDHLVCITAPVHTLVNCEPRALPWLRAWLARELRGTRPVLVALAAHPGCRHFTSTESEGVPAATRADLEVAAVRLREWGLASDVEAFWLAAEAERRPRKAA